MRDASASPRRRLAHRTTGRRRTRSGKVPIQEFSDVQALLASLDFEYGCDVGYELGALARDQRALNEALAGPSDVRADEHPELMNHARSLITRNGPLHWPLPASEVPAPNFLLSEELAAIAGRERSLSLQDIGEHWMAVQQALHAILSHLALFPPMTVPADAVKKEADKARASKTAMSPSLLADVLAFKPVLAQRRIAARSLDWRDVVSAAYACDDPRMAQAADAVRERMQALFASHAVEPHLERKTWSMKKMPDVAERVGIVRQAREKARVVLETPPSEIWQEACASFFPEHEKVPEAWEDWQYYQDGELPEVGSDWEERVKEALEWDSEEGEEEEEGGEEEEEEGEEQEEEEEEEEDGQENGEKDAEHNENLESESDSISSSSSSTSGIPSPTLTVSLSRSEAPPEALFDAPPDTPIAPQSTSLSPIQPRHTPRPAATARPSPSPSSQSPSKRGAPPSIAPAKRRRTLPPRRGF